MSTTHLTILPMRRNEIDECAELSVQAFADYEYFTNSESNLAFYRHLGFVVSDFQELNCRGTKMGSWSIVYDIPQQQ